MRFLSGSVARDCLVGFLFSRAVLVSGGFSGLCSGIGACSRLYPGSCNPLESPSESHGTVLGLRNPGIRLVLGVFVLLGAVSGLFYFDEDWFHVFGRAGRCSWSRGYARRSVGGLGVCEGSGLEIL